MKKLEKSVKEQIAKECLEIYAPISHRLGMSKVKSELEDISFRILLPDEYHKIKEQIDEKKEEREEYYKLLAIIDRDNELLSAKAEISDIDFAKWNRSIFKYAKNSSNLVLKKGIKVSADIPKVVKNKVDPRCIKSRKNYGLNVI